MYLKKGELPIDTVGTLKLPQIPTRDLIGEYFIKRSISDDILKEHFLGMINQLFTGIANRDEAIINKIAEPTFADKLLEITKNLKGPVTYEAPKDDAIEKCYLIDKIFVQGISTDRYANDWNTDYIVQKDLEPKGLRTYLHKFHLGFMPYYFKRDHGITYEKLADKNMEATERYSMQMKMREEINNQRKRITDSRFSMMLKVTVQLT